MTNTTKPPRRRARNASRAKDEIAGLERCVRQKALLDAELALKRLARRIAKTPGGGAATLLSDGALIAAAEIRELRRAPA